VAATPPNRAGLEGNIVEFAKALIGADPPRVVLAGSRQNQKGRLSRLDSSCEKRENGARAGLRVETRLAEIHAAAGSNSSAAVRRL
jgi:hypothetical protein